MSEATTVPPTATEPPGRSWRSALAALELDTRLLGMIGALAVIWIFFNIVSGGSFITPRNLWNLSVQSSSIAIMATGMVLIIVSRNIDLSVGSMLGLIGYTMAMVQVNWLPNALGVNYNEPYIWVVALLVGLAMGAVIGGVTGFIVSYGGVPSFIVTLGGLLVWRGIIFLGLLACAGIVYTLWAGRRRKRRYGFPVRAMWAEVAVGVVGCAAILGTIWIANSYSWPPALASQYAVENGITEPPGGLIIPTGVAIPVVVMILVGLVMTYIATRRRFGRYVYAIGGNPDAAELGGINVRRTIMMTFVLMGILAAVSAAVQTARLNAAVTNLGVQNELDVISAAVIGGTSFAGGIGTIPGAILGAVVMQSLRSGMLLLNVDSPTQDIVVGAVLVAAVGFDSYVRRRSS
jgi:D-xylose transport system permease protein